MQRRRDFLKLLAGSMGGLFLSSCAGGPIGPAGMGSFSGGPNGFQFIPLFSTGQTLPDGRILESLPGGALINDVGHILFYGQTTAGMGLYELLPDFEAIARNGRSQLLSARKVVVTGDTLPNGAVALGVGTVAGNDHGHYALVARTDRQSRDLLFLPRDGSLEVVAGHRTHVSEDGVHLGGNFVDIDLTDRNDLLLVDHYSSHDRVQSHQGLFVLPGMSLEGARLLQSTGTFLPDAEGTIGTLGLVDHNESGDFLAQVSGQGHGQASPDPRGTLPAQGLLRGNIHDQQSRRLLVAPPSFRVAPRAARETATGSMIFGPRLADETDHTTFIVHESENHQVLYFHDQPIIRVGDLSPGGRVIRGFVPGVLSPHGELHLILVTDIGHELVQYSSGAPLLLLNRGDRIDGRLINAIIFGFHLDQVDRLGRLIFVTEFTDGSSAVVLGLPV